MLIVVAFFISNAASGADPWKTPGILATIPFKDDGTPLSLPVTVDGAKYSFVLDTNSTSSLIDKTLTARLKDLDKETVIHTSGRSIVSSKYGISDFCIAGIRCDSISTLNSVDLKPFTQLLARDVHGIVGMDALRHYVVHLDFDNEYMMIGDPNLVGTPPGTSIPLLLDNQLFPCISASVRGVRYSTFCVDTGLTSTGCLNFRDFKSLSSTGALVGTGVNARVVVGDSSEVVVERARCEELQLAEYSHRGLVLSPGRSNTFGRSLLRRYRVTFNFVKGRAYFDPSAKFGLRDRADYDGMVVDQNRTVLRIVRDSVSDRAGLKIGDKLLKMDGVDARQLSLEAINAILCLSRVEDLQIVVARGETMAEITIPGG